MLRRLTVIQHQTSYKTTVNTIDIVVFSWTQTDTDVACQQLGFETGNFSFIAFALNDSSYMLYYRPNCVGNESSIMDCPGSQNIQIGSGICRKSFKVRLFLRVVKRSMNILDFSLSTRPLLRQWFDNKETGKKLFSFFSKMNI